MSFRLLAGAALCTLAPAAALARETPMHPAPAYSAASGYFAAPSTLPFHAPDFRKFTDADLQPAIEQGIALKRAEIARIADNPAAPTFANTLVAMERAGQMLDRANAVLNQEQAANTNPTLDKIQEAVAPELTALNDAVYLNPRLFGRVKSLHDRRASLGLDAEDAMLLDYQYEEFVHAGALLSPAKKAQLTVLNTRISGLETAFSQKLTAATAAESPVFATRAELTGLTDAEIDEAAKLAVKMGHPGQFALALVNTTQQPMLTRLTNRATRQTLFQASLERTSRGDAHDLTGIVADLASARARKAALLGLPNFASYAMYDRMVRDPAQAVKFLTDFVPALAAAQARDKATFEQAAHVDGVAGPLQAWDWSYYAEKVRKARYDLDEDQIKPYFELWHTVEEGVFYAANQMYGVSFKRRTDLPTYQADMRVYTVYDKDGSELGLVYIDPYARPNKQGGAWMGNFVEQSFVLGNKPVIYNTHNIPKPAAGQLTLLTFDEVTTLFHEFGHGLHGLFANQKYPALSGTNTARDWVEFPSQFNENAATAPTILDHYARHYQTGAVIPASLLAKITAARNFNQGLDFGETVSAALLDMRWHELGADAGKQDVKAFQRQALAMTALDNAAVPPRYRTAYFRHIWANDYAAGYYSYIWTSMLAHDAWEWVAAHGGPTRANGEHIRAAFLGQGHTKDYAVMYRDMTGRDPQVGALLRAHGLVADNDKPTADGTASH